MPGGEWDVGSVVVDVACGAEDLVGDSGGGPSDEIGAPFDGDEEVAGFSVHGEIGVAPPVRSRLASVQQSDWRWGSSGALISTHCAHNRMPAASPSQRRENLVRMTGCLSAHCSADLEKSRAAQTWATAMPLTHATDFGKLPQVLHNAALLSQVQLGRSPGAAEAKLDTVDDVFLYAGAFSYPATECGFLFVPSVEVDHRNDGVATPFDSGALASMSVVQAPTPCQDGVAFVRDHELPVSDYRGLLASIIADYSRSAEAYLDRPDDFACACGTLRGHPFGLTGGDRRAATFEVRIPQRVPLQSPHLRAVFVRKGFAVAGLHQLFAQGISIVCYEADEGSDFFHALRTTCISFIQEHLIP